MTIYLTSDEHFGHRNILIYEPMRPFRKVSEMDSTLIKWHNEIVGPKDHVIHNGDFVPFYGPEKRGYFRSLMQRYEGHGIHHLIIGSHDEAPVPFYLDIGFTSVHSVMWFRYKGLRFVVVHDPAKYIAIPGRDGVVTLCGHVHSLFDRVPGKNVINVGVDVRQYRPISIDKIIEML